MAGDWPPAAADRLWPPAAADRLWPPAPATGVVAADEGFLVSFYCCRSEIKNEGEKIATAKHTRILFFFVDVESERKVADNRCERLKTSLPETLAYFYPLAGRVKDNAIIECKDEGVEFCEAHVHGFLVQILKRPDNDTIQQFVPDDDDDDDDDAEFGNGFLLKVQVNLFDCRGLVIGVSSSHKIVDASTIASFIKAWSSISIGCITESTIPKYCLGSLYPSMDFLTVLSPFEAGDFNCIPKSFVEKVQILNQNIFEP
ncbi:salutaridinol 7-O-acetyltransferase-like [Neltuma alba]|uniref:salutaridinol 7-O-acetyltransferase-like n=1 Tax=Neltuma alba TaxID=207710 RepID=UPI0010A39C9F|nr:salutaridinol 7-O-acetyltransferase-like [Prosopis alba]